MKIKPVCPTSCNAAVTLVGKSQPLGGESKGQQGKSCHVPSVFLVDTAEVPAFQHFPRLTSLWGWQHVFYREHLKTFPGPRFAAAGAASGWSHGCRRYDCLPAGPRCQRHWILCLPRLVCQEKKWTAMMSRRCSNEVYFQILLGVEVWDLTLCSSSG